MAKRLWMAQTALGGAPPGSPKRKPADAVRLGAARADTGSAGIDTTWGSCWGGTVSDDEGPRAPPCGQNGASSRLSFYKPHCTKCKRADVFTQD